MEYLTYHMPVGLTSNNYCSRKYCTFTVTSTLTYIILPKGVQRPFAHPVEGVEKVQVEEERTRKRNKEE
jgi:hypothetical protein